MDIYSDYANPVGYDQRLIMDKLGYDTYSTIEKKKPDSVNDRLRLALLEHELAESRRKLSDADNKPQVIRDADNKPQVIRETFVSGGGGCVCGASEGMRSRSNRYDLEDGETIMGISMKKFMVILVVIMAAFCVIQYFSYKNEMHELMSAMCLMLKNNEAVNQTAAQATPMGTSMATPMATPTVTTAP